MSKGWQHTVVCLSMCVWAPMRANVCAHCVALSADIHNPATVTTTTPTDKENNGKIMKNYLHETAQLTIISQTLQPEGAWLWRFIIAYWIIWINLTHLGLCVFPSSHFSRLFVSDNYTKWVIAIWAPFCFLPPHVALASLTFQTKFSRNLMKLTSRFTQHSADESLEKQAGWLRVVEEWSQKAAKLNWRFWNSPLISTLLSHTFKFWVTETCMCCFNLRGHC